MISSEAIPPGQIAKAYDTVDDITRCWASLLENEDLSGLPDDSPGPPNETKYFFLLRKYPMWLARYLRSLAEAQP